MDGKFVEEIVGQINAMAMASTQEIKLMEVCGTHTAQISRLGIRSMLTSNIQLLSGPGCPVCVTDDSYIDGVIEMLERYEVTIVTFGDMIRVRGNKGSLLDQKAVGKDIRVVHSPLDSIGMAQKEPDKHFIFLAVGFETTAPIVALAIKTASERKIKNLSFLTSIKLMSPILHYILDQPHHKIKGFICPGHVATVTGAEYFRFISEQYKLPAAICGFEAVDLLGGIYHLVKHITQAEQTKPNFINLYTQWVKPSGTTISNQLIDEVFKVYETRWRGIGRIDGSGLAINASYSHLDARRLFRIKETEGGRERSKCDCKDILLGNKSPNECKLFRKVCHPGNPYGPCMVSTEGACAVSYQYGKESENERENTTLSW